MDTRSERFGKTLHIAIASAFMVFGILALILFGYVGVGRGEGDFATDMRYLYVAGEMWERSGSPYDLDAFKGEMKTIAGIDSVSYAYPPNSAPLALGLSLGSISSAIVAIGALNLLAIAALLLFVRAGVGSTATPHDDEARTRANMLLCMAVVIGNPFTAHVAWMGQTTLISGAFLLGSWLAAHRRLDVAAGILLGISAFKPQLAFLVGFWFLLDRRWLLLAVAALTTLAISIWPMATTGLEGSWIAWVHSLIDYQGGIFNTVTFKHVFGLRSMLATMGIVVPSLMPLALVCTFLLYWFRKQYEAVWLVAPILILSYLLIYAHDYDLAPLAIITYPLLKAAKGNKLTLASIAVLAAIIFFPQRIWEKIDMADLARSRELALLALLGIYLVICRVTRMATEAREAAPSLR